MRTCLMALCALMPAAAAAQDAAVQGTAPNRIRSVIIRSGEVCPKSGADEIVVCTTIDEPFRIPRQFRDVPSRANQSWVARTESLDEIGRVAGGVPNSCSPIGTGGQSGCTQQLIDRWRADRRQQAADASGVP